MQINQLTTVDSVSAGDQVVFFSTNNGSTRRISVSDLAAYFNDQNTVDGREQAQSFSPSVTGLTVTIQPTVNGNDKWLRITPTGIGVNSMTINLPLSTTLIDGQEVLVTTTLGIITLTIGLNGAVGAPGAPASMVNNGYFRLRYDLVTQSWYRIG